MFGNHKAFYKDDYNRDIRGLYYIFVNSSRKDKSFDGSMKGSVGWWLSRR